MSLFHLKRSIIYPEGTEIKLWAVGRYHLGDNWGETRRAIHRWGLAEMCKIITRELPVPDVTHA